MVKRVVSSSNLRLDVTNPHKNDIQLQSDFGVTNTVIGHIEEIRSDEDDDTDSIDEGNVLTRMGSSEISKNHKTRGGPNGDDTEEGTDNTDEYKDSEEGTDENDEDIELPMGKTETMGYDDDEVMNDMNDQPTRGNIKNQNEMSDDVHIGDDEFVIYSDDAPNTRM